MNVDTAFRSDEHFTRTQFRRWIAGRRSGDGNHYELLRGQIVMSPPAGWTHGRLEMMLARRIEEHVVGEGLGLAFGPSTGFDLPSGDTVQPDVSFVSAERFRKQPPTHPNAFVRAVPNLVIEILSPATRRRDLGEKKALYADNDVDEYWIVDPTHRSVTVFQRTTAGYGRGRACTRGTVRSRVLPKLRLPVVSLFQI